MTMRPTLAASVAFVLLAAPAIVAAQCTPIQKLPAHVSAPGCHVLQTSAVLSLGSGVAITIDADDVVLDLGGHSIRNDAPLDNTAFGITAYRRNNVVVRNGSLRGFQTAVALGLDAPDGSFGGYVVEGLHLQDSRLFGLDLRGMSLTARGNRISRTGGSRAPGLQGEGYAIYAQGNFVSIVDNDIHNVFGDPFATWGIRVASSGAATVERNRVLSVGFGVEIDRRASAGSCRDNTFGEIAVRSFDCPIDAGGNAGQIR